LGHVTTLVRERVRNLDALLLETNHDPDLLLEASYPWELKQRIKGSSGHLSNQDAAKLLKSLSEEEAHRLRYVLAMHISEETNTPALAVQTLEQACALWRNGRQLEIVATSPYSSTRIFDLS